MSIAEEIYRRAQVLPEEAAREVLDFIGYLEQKYERPPDQAWRTEQTRQVAGSRYVRENPNDEVWNDLLFRQSQ